MEKDWGIGKLEDFDADSWFHVSSEGELEQIWPWIHKRRKQGKKSLVIFTSPSVLSHANKFHKPKEGLAFRALPLTSFFLWGRNSIFQMKPPKEFFMVRYDFFAELLFLSSRTQRSVLLAATLKGKKEKLRKNPLKRWWLKSVLQTFDQVFTSTESDREGIVSLFKGEVPFEITSLDFRHGQILLRQKEKTNLLGSHCEEGLKDLLQGFEWNERLIFGSLWVEELKVFSEDFLCAIREKKIVVFLAPHKLKGEEWEKIADYVSELESSGIEISRWDQVGIEGKGNLILCQVPGLLCEIYPFFGHCFVGGGHGRSVHSLLEPYWGGGHVYCGPRTHRSTEYDFVHDESPSNLHIVRELENFYPIWKKNEEVPVDRNHREVIADELLKKQEVALDKTLL